MVQYWITQSNWPEDAHERINHQIWWYMPGRDEINEGDVVLIYQSGSNKEAEINHITISQNWKCTFIGSFSVGRILPRNDPSIPTTWQNSTANWIQITNVRQLSEPNLVKRAEIDDELLLELTKRKNVGLIFKNSTWVSINEQYYRLVEQAMH